MELVITNIANGSEGIGRYLILIYIISHYTGFDSIYIISHYTGFDSIYIISHYTDFDSHLHYQSLYTF